MHELALLVRVAWRMTVRAMMSCVGVILKRVAARTLLRAWSYCHKFMKNQLILILLCGSATDNGLMNIFVTHHCSFPWSSWKRHESVYTWENST